MSGLQGKVALITGASRGIGRVTAERLAREGVHVVAASKTDAPHPRLPGTIHETVAACEALGPAALAVRTDVRDGAQVKAAVDAAVERFGRLDIVIHNAGALWWKPIADTPLRRFDLVVGVNARGAFALAHHALPHLLADGGGHFITLSPPVWTEPRLYAGMTAYLISKFGMTMVAQGLAAEHPDAPLSSNALWPETLIDSAATRVYGIGTPAQWYKPELVADAVHALVSRPPGEQSGKALLVLDVLRDAGVTDFVPYRCDPDHEPPVLTGFELPRVGGSEKAGGALG
ncbi:MAG: SDR family oxidoreductase [Alphaproteobacteria bacterium]|nr:SDR family oxidoreductase [Alphaproteobacteria bacterium]